MDDRHLFSTAALQLSRGCQACMALWLVQFRDGPEISLFPLAFLLYGPLLYGLDLLFLRRPRTLLSVVLLNTALGVAMVAGGIALDGWKDSSYFLILSCLCGWITAQGARSALHPPALRSYLLGMDLSALLFLLFLCFLTLTGLPLVRCVPGALSLAATGLGLMAYRTGHALNLRSWGLLGLVLAALSGLVLLLVQAVAAPAGQGMVALWQGLLSLGQKLGGLFYRWLLWLDGLLPDAEGKTPPQEAIPTDLPAMTMGPDPTVSAISLAVTLVFALAVILLGIRLLRRRRVVVIRQQGGLQRAGGPSLREGLGKLLSRWRTRLAVKRYLHRNRGTPVGVYYTLVHRCRKTPWHKRPGETPREFLTRVKDRTPPESPLSGQIQLLLEAVDAALYAPTAQPGLTRAQGKGILRGVGAMIRRDRLHQMVRDLGQFIKRGKPSKQGDP